MAAKVWRTLEELNADHERLCGEVEKLKEEFEAHGNHNIALGTVGQPILPIGAEPAKCVECGTILTGKEKVVCRDCIPF